MNEGNLNRVLYVIGPTWLNHSYYCALADVRLGFPFSTQLLRNKTVCIPPLAQKHCELKFLSEHRNPGWASGNGTKRIEINRVHLRASVCPPIDAHKTHEAPNH